MRRARFRVIGASFDGVRQATVEIDRASEVVSVRPHRRHRTYSLPLSRVAEIIIWQVVKAETAQKVRRKKVRRGKL